jgi:hypothetical protein
MIISQVSMQKNDVACSKHMQWTEEMFDALVFNVRAATSSPSPFATLAASSPAAAP